MPTMNRVLFSLLVVTLALAACNGGDSPGSQTSTPQADSATAAMGATAALPDSAVRHLVIFKYRPDATEAQISEITTAFRDLQNRIPGILSFEHGVNNSPEGLNLGFTHAYTLTFESAAARDAYLPHPAHATFGELLNRLGAVEEVFVVDYVPAP
jgi:hypothetical protein